MLGGEFKANCAVGGAAMTFLYLLWLIFAAIFFYFGWTSWQNMKSEIRPFKVREGEGGEGEGGLDPAMSTDFNQYLAKINKENHARNRNATVAYFIAGGISLFSLILVTIV